MIAIAGKNVGREVFCMMHSAFSPPGPRHFNKEQTPLAILRYQPTVSRWCFRCFGAHLLRSPLIVKQKTLLPFRQAGSRNPMMFRLPAHLEPIPIGFGLLATICPG
jgi:hypothetical protein